MIKRMRGRLSVKVFFLTSILLIFMCAGTYAAIAHFMPLTYSSGINSDIEKNAKKLVAELEKVKFEDSGPLFDQFVLDNMVDLSLMDKDGNVVEHPGKINTGLAGDSVSGTSLYITVTSDHLSAAAADTELTDDGGRETSSKENVDTARTKDASSSADIMNSYSFSSIQGGGEEAMITQVTDHDVGTGYEVTFADGGMTYEMFVAAGLKEVNQAVEALQKILPWLAAGILAASMLSSFFYSRYITKPIVRISGIAKKMSGLEFDWACKEKRRDEIGILSDSLNELSQKLSAALEDLQEANASLQEDIEKERLLEHRRLEFFSAVSHELKTPITVIKGQLEGMLCSIGVYKDRDKYLARSYGVACTMEELVQEILTVSRMEASGFSPKMQNFDFAGLVKECIRMQEELYTQKEMELVYQEFEPTAMTGDYKLMKKAVNNLINNALHYSPIGGSVIISAVPKEEGVYFRVENTGVHLMEDVIPRLFEAFYRAEQSRNRNTGGSGLGLYIVKMILELHHGEYRIENTESGVAFTFFIKNTQETQAVHKEIC